MALFSTNALRPKTAPQNAGDADKTKIVVDEVSEENLRERRYLWTARAFAIVFVVSFITNIIMLMALFSLVPLVRVQPYELIFSDKNTQTVAVQPLQADKTVLNGISESMIRQYVTARHSITSDPDEMAYRWGANGIVRQLSTDNIFASFSPEAEEVLKAALKSQITRNIEINSVIPLVSQREGEYWVVDYNRVEMSPQSATKKVEPWVSTIYITYEPYKGTWENRLKNPIGFKVMRYGTETKQQFDARERELLRDKNG